MALWISWHVQVELEQEVTKYQENLNNTNEELKLSKAANHELEKNTAEFKVGRHARLLSLDGLSSMSKIFRCLHILVLSLGFLYVFFAMLFCDVVL